MNALNSVPINKQAAIAVSRQFEYNSPKLILEIESISPFQIRPVPKQAKDLIGVRFGRFTVVGFSRDHKGRWCVRCDCGTYGLRRTRAITNKENAQDRCQECRHLAYLKRADHYRSTGKDGDIRNY